MSKNNNGRLVLAAIVMAFCCFGSELASAQDITIKEIGDFLVGGKNITLSGLPDRQIRYSPGGPLMSINPNGDFQVGQMYTQYVKLAHPTAPYPVLFWHGGGLTGAMWGNTPDGRPGWQQLFLRAGYDTYVSDAVERGRSGWARFPEIYKGEPLFRTKKEAWELFRLGPPDSYHSLHERIAYPAVRFPVDRFDDFMNQAVPRWVTNDDLTQEADDILVQKVCPCIIVAHSSGVPFAIRSAFAAPDLVKAVVAIEAGNVVDMADLQRSKPVKFLFVWGDHLSGPGLMPFWQATYPRAQKWNEALRKAGVTSAWIDLPAQGITGNTHMMMMDNNNDQVAKIIQEWLATNVTSR